MSDIITLANQIAAEKENIRQAIENRGVSLPASAPFSEYAGKIPLIESQVSEGDFYWKDTPYDDTQNSFTVPGNYDAIDEGAFAGKTNLQSVNLNNVRNVGDNAFSGCTSLTSFTADHAVKFDDNVLSGCTSLTSINNTSAKIIGNNFLSGTPVTSITLGAIRIGANVNANNSALTSVSLPNAKHIGDGAFYNCDHLDTISVPNLEYVGDSAFYKMNEWNYNFDKSVVDISLPKVKVIGTLAFYGIRGLRSIDMPLVERIEQEAFNYTGSNSGKFTSLNIPNCKHVGFDAFRYSYTTGTSSYLRRLNSLTIGDDCELCGGSFYNMPYTVIGKIGTLDFSLGHNYIFYCDTGTSYNADFSGLHTVIATNSGGRFCDATGNGSIPVCFNGEIDLKNLTVIQGGTSSNKISMFLNFNYDRGGITKVWINGNLTVSESSGVSILSGLDSRTHIYTDHSGPTKPSNWTNIGGNGTWHFNCSHEDFESGIYNL